MIESPEGWAAIWAQFAENLLAGWSWSGFERSAFFLNSGDAHFQSVGYVLGADQVSDGRGLAAGDIDNDGDLDLVGATSRTHPHLYVLRNDLDTDRHHLFVELKGRDRRSAVGAKLLLTADGKTQRRDYLIGQGYLAQHASAQHFGLGSASEVERLEITWPDGEVQTLEDLAVDRTLVITQGDASQTEVAHRERNFNATRRLPKIEWDRTHLSLLPHPRPDLSPFKVETAAGETVSLAVGPEGAKPGGPFLLVNLFGPWCSNCKREMPEVTAMHAEGPSGIQVVGFALDADEEEDAEAVAEAIDTWGINFPVEHLTGLKKKRFLGVLEPVFGQGAMTLPTTLLLSPGGKVMGVMQGDLDVERVVRYVEAIRSR